MTKTHRRKEKESIMLFFPKYIHRKEMIMIIMVSLLLDFSIFFHLSRHIDPIHTFEILQYKGVNVN